MDISQNNDNNNTNTKNNNNDKVEISDLVSRTFEEAGITASVSAPTDPGAAPSLKRKGPVITDIKGMERRVRFVRRPGPASKTRYASWKLGGEEKNEPSAGVKRSLPQDEAEEEEERLAKFATVEDEETDVMSALESEAPPNPAEKRASPQHSTGGKVKRGRGRPPTTGEYVGLYKAKLKVREEEEKEIERRVEKELLEQEAAKRESRRLLACNLVQETKGTDHEDTDEEQPRRRFLVQEALDGANTVLEVAKKSSNLKGTMIKLLQNAAGNIIVASKKLGSLSVNEEVKALERENRALKDRLSWMEKEVEDLKKEMREMRAAPPHLGPMTPAPENTEGEPSAPSMDIEVTSREATLRLLTTRNAKREKERKKRENGDGKTMETTPDTPSASSYPPAMEAQRVATEVEEIGQAVESLRLKDTPVTGITTPGISAEMETMMGSLLRQIGNMMTARFAAIEDRLLPEKTLRPPLQADKRKGNNGTSQEAMGGEEAREARDRSVGAKGKGKDKERTKKKENDGEKRAKTSQPLPPSEKGSATLPLPIPPTSLSYADAAKKERKGKKEVATGKAKNPPKKDGSLVSTRASSTHKKVDGLSPGDKGPPKKGRRDRKTAAVVITVLPQTGAKEGQKPESSSLTKVLQEATSKVDIKKLGIEYLRPRRAKTGGLILEVPGEGSALKADKLAASLREALRGDNNVRIARPVMTAEIRVSGLDDAATEESVAVAIAEAGGCTTSEVKVGEIKRTPSGLMAAWVRCPKNAADKTTKVGRIKLGWTMARVEALKARPLQCHKCLGFGHVQVKCPAVEDRSKNCYRCGLPGHMASGCIAPPSCQLCASKGREKGHRLGGPACPFSPNFRRKGEKGKKKEAAKRTEESLERKKEGKGKGKGQSQSQPQPAPRANPRARSQPFKDGEKGKETPKRGKRKEEKKETPATTSAKAPMAKEENKGDQKTPPLTKERGVSSKEGRSLEEAMDTS